MDARPELFVFLGDNVYGDTEDMAVLAGKYAKLAAQPGFQKLKGQAGIVATWDDHDYGADDVGREYPMKRESKKLFLDFFGEPAASPRRLRDGVPYPIWDITSSGLNRAARRIRVNRHRIGEAVAQHNFGLLTVDWDRPTSLVRVETRGVDGKAIHAQAIDAGTLSFS